MGNKNKILLILLNWLIYLFPLFYILGNLFINTSIILILLIGLMLYQSKIFDFKKDNLVILITTFFLIVIISTFFESIFNPGNVKVFKSIIFLRYLILLLVIRYAVINNHINLKNILISSLIFSSFVSLDVILQFVTGKNIIGFESTIAHRSSFFADEAIAGGFIQRFSILGFFITLILFKKNYFKAIFSSTFLLISFLASFYSGNKMPTFMIVLFAIGFLTSLIFYLNIYRKKIFIFASIIPLLLIIFGEEKINTFFAKIMKDTYFLSHANTFVAGIPNFKVIYSEVVRDYSELDKYKGKIWFFKTEEFKDKERYRYLKKHSTYNHLYITSLDLFLESPLRGRGIKSFRETCKERVHLPNRICSTHQHNYHLQILNDAGLIGYFIFFFTTIFLIFKCLKKNNLRSNIYFYAFLSVILVEFFPFRSTGGFFSTINSSYIFIMMGILFGLKELKYKT